MPPRLLDPRPYFANLPDPCRVTRNKLHSLHDIWLIVLSAVRSGIEDGVGMKTFARECKPGLRGFPASQRVPSFDNIESERVRGIVLITIVDRSPQAVWRACYWRR